MAKILVENIDTVLLNPVHVDGILIERDLNFTGDSAIDELVKKKYLEQKYDLRPTTKDEARRRGLKGFNGLRSSIPVFNIYSEQGKTIVTGDIFATRYLIGQAMRDIEKERREAENPLSNPQINAMSPNMLNVSLIAPVKIKGEYYLLSQIKGAAIGSGTIHTGVAAGNVQGKHLLKKYPLIAALQTECSKELGIDLSHLRSTSFIFMVDERETGQVNFASVAMNLDADNIFGAYEALTKQKILASSDLEVMALATMPIMGLSLVPLEKGEFLENLTCYFPTKDGLDKRIEPKRGVRPYTKATIDYLSKKENRHFLLEKAGY